MFETWLASCRTLILLLHTSFSPPHKPAPSPIALLLKHPVTHVTSAITPRAEHLATTFFAPRRYLRSTSLMPTNTPRSRQQATYLPNSHALWRAFRRCGGRSPLWHVCSILLTSVLKHGIPFSSAATLLFLPLLLHLNAYANARACRYRCRRTSLAAGRVRRRYRTGAPLCRFDAGMTATQFRGVLPAEGGVI